MTWFLIAYFLGLVFFAANPDKIANKRSFRTAWVWFSLVPFVHFLFALIGAGNIHNTENHVLVKLWSNGIAWLFLGISLLVLLGALIPNDSSDRE